MGEGTRDELRTWQSGYFCACLLSSSPPEITDRQTADLSSHKTRHTPPLIGWLHWLHYLCLTQTVNSHSSSGNVYFPWFLGSSFLSWLCFAQPTLLRGPAETLIALKSSVLPQASTCGQECWPLMSSSLKLKILQAACHLKFRLRLWWQATTSIPLLFSCAVGQALICFPHSSVFYLYHHISSSFPICTALLLLDSPLSSFPLSLALICITLLQEIAFIFSVSDWKEWKWHYLCCHITKHSVSGFSRSWLQGPPSSRVSAFRNHLKRRKWIVEKAMVKITFSNIYTGNCNASCMSGRMDFVLS